MDELKLREIWKKEEEAAHIHGWDFSHINGRYEEENDLPWDYEKIIKSYLIFSFLYITILPKKLFQIFFH